MRKNPKLENRRKRMNIIFFYDSVEEFDTEGTRMIAMEKLFEKIEKYIEARDYSTIDDYIEIFLRRNFSFHLHVCFLTATFRVKDKLEKRCALFDETFRIGLLVLDQAQTESTIDHLE